MCFKAGDSCPKLVILILKRGHMKQTIRVTCIRTSEIFPKCNSSTSCRPVFCSKLVDGSCRFQFPIALVDLAVRSFPWFSPKFTKIRVRIPEKDPQLVHLTYILRSLVWQLDLNLQPTNLNAIIRTVNCKKFWNAYSSF